MDTLPVFSAASGNIDSVEAVETQRESSGHAPRAGGGDADGEGESRWREGCSWDSCVLAMIAICWRCRIIMLLSKVSSKLPLFRTDLKECH